MLLKHHLFIPSLISAWECINSYECFFWDWSFYSGSFWRLTQFFSPSVKMTEHSYSASFCQSPLKVHWIRPFVFPRGFFVLFLHQAICQLQYQFLSITLAHVAFEELDMWGRLLNLMFANVTSVQISETLTLFFCKLGSIYFDCYFSSCSRRTILNYSVQFCEANLIGALIFVLCSCNSNYFSASLLRALNLVAID